MPRPLDVSLYMHIHIRTYIIMYIYALFCKRPSTIFHCFSPVKFLLYFIVILIVSRPRCLFSVTVRRPTTLYNTAVSLFLVFIVVHAYIYSIVRISIYSVVFVPYILWYYEYIVSYKYIIPVLSYLVSAGGQLLL